MVDFLPSFIVFLFFNSFIAFSIAFMFMYIQVHRALYSQVELKAMISMRNTRANTRESQQQSFDVANSLHVHNSNQSIILNLNNLNTPMNFVIRQDLDAFVASIKT